VSDWLGYGHHESWRFARESLEPRPNALNPQGIGKRSTEPQARRVLFKVGPQRPESPSRMRAIRLGLVRLKSHAGAFANLFSKGLSVSAKVA
jgi:hypothetical protein